MSSLAFCAAPINESFVNQSDSLIEKEMVEDS